MRVGRLSVIHARPTRIIGYEAKKRATVLAARVEHKNVPQQWAATCTHVHPRALTCTHVHSRALTCTHVHSRASACTHVQSLASAPDFLFLSCFGFIFTTSYLSHTETSNFGSGSRFGSHFSRRVGPGSHFTLRFNVRMDFFG